MGTTGRGRNLVHAWTAEYIPNGYATCQSPTHVTKKYRQMPTSTSCDNSNFTSDGRICSHDRAIRTSDGLQSVGMRQQNPLQHLIHKGARFIHQLFHGWSRDVFLSVGFIV